MSGKTEANKQWDLHSFSSMHYCFTGHTSHTAGTAQQHWAPSISLNYPWSVPGQLGCAGSSLGWWEVSLLWQRWHWLGFKVLQPNLARVYCRNLLTPGLGPLCALPSLPSCPVCAALGFGLSQIPGTFALPCAPPRDTGAVPHTLGCLCPVCTRCLRGTHESFHLPFYTTDDNLLWLGWPQCCRKWEQG